MSVLVCDDVREEVGHKATLVGVYQSDLCVTEVPVVLPRLAFFVRVRAHVDRPLRQLAVLVKRDGNEFLRAQIAAEALPPVDPASDGYYHLQIVLKTQPFEISGPEELSFSAETEGATIDGGRLQIRASAPYSTSLQ